LSLSESSEGEWQTVLSVFLFSKTASANDQRLKQAFFQNSSRVQITKVALSGTLATLSQNTMLSNKQVPPPHHFYRRLFLLTLF
jgi:uncharacterized membrane protein YjjP (DUF1212 family)